MTIAPSTPTADAHDCLDCPTAFPTFGEMAEHRFLTHDVPVPETYAEVGRELPRVTVVATGIACRRYCGRSDFTSAQSRGQHERWCQGLEVPRKTTEPPAPVPAKEPSMARGHCTRCGVGHGRSRCPKVEVKPAKAVKSKQAAKASTKGKALDPVERLAVQLEAEAAQYETAAAERRKLVQGLREIMKSAPIRRVGA